MKLELAEAGAFVDDDDDDELWFVAVAVAVVVPGVTTTNLELLACDKIKL